MEQPQSRRHGAEGKSTHDFLSLCAQVQDPIPPQGGYPKTHDFLQPLERAGKPNAKEESELEITTPEKPTPPVAPPSGEHILPGGIGTYSISHNSYFNQRVLKPEGSLFAVAQANFTDHNEENSNCSSQTGSGFTLWEESVVKKGKTGKDSHSGSKQATRGGKIGGGQWAVWERPLQSSSNFATSNPSHVTATTSFSSRSSSQPPSQKSQSFMDMLKSAKAAHDEDDDDEEEYVLKKESSPPPLKIRAGSGGGTSTDQKPNTPRSKHSATEQRRRSKINDRFHMLRDLIPHGDQKRDKASFLLEVIEYIQYLQEKVHKYEGPYQGWNQELPKLMPWRGNKQAEGYADQSQDQTNDNVPKMAFAAKFDENGINFSSSNPMNAQKATKYDMKTITNLTATNHHFGLTNHSPSMQTNIFMPGGNAGTVSPTPTKPASDVQNTISQPQFQFWQGMPRTPDCDSAIKKLKEQDLTIESGVISISTVYSRELLNTLTQTLQSSGVDLSQANISVQIDLGKRANGRVTTSASTVKNDDIHCINQVIASSKGASSGDEPDQDCKRLRTS